MFYSPPDTAEMPLGAAGTEIQEAPGVFLQRPHQREEAPASGWRPGGPMAGLGVCRGAGCTERGAGASEGAQPTPAPLVMVGFGRGSPGRPGLCWQVTVGTGSLSARREARQPGSLAEFGGDANRLFLTKLDVCSP